MITRLGRTQNKWSRRKPKQTSGGIVRLYGLLHLQTALQICTTVTVAVVMCSRNGNGAFGGAPSAPIKKQCYVFCRKGFGASPLSANATRLDESCGTSQV